MRQMASGTSPSHDYSLFIVRLSDAREHLDKAVIEGASYPGVQEARRILASF